MPTLQIIIDSDTEERVKAAQVSAGLNSRSSAGAMLVELGLRQYELARRLQKKAMLELVDDSLVDRAVA
jgi:hypothetical protein